MCVYTGVGTWLYLRCELLCVVWGCGGGSITETGSLRDALQSMSVSEKVKHSRERQREKTGWDIQAERMCVHVWVCTGAHASVRGFMKSGSESQREDMARPPHALIPCSANPALWPRQLSVLTSAALIPGSHHPPCWPDGLQSGSWQVTPSLGGQLQAPSSHQVQLITWSLATIRDPKPCMHLAGV